MALTTADETTADPVQPLPFRVVPARREGDPPLLEYVAEVAVPVPANLQGHPIDAFGRLLGSGQTYTSEKRQIPMLLDSTVGPGPAIMKLLDVCAALARANETLIAERDAALAKVAEHERQSEDFVPQRRRRE